MKKRRNPDCPNCGAAELSIGYPSGRLEQLLMRVRRMRCMPHYCWNCGAFAIYERDRADWTVWAGPGEDTAFVVSLGRLGAKEVNEG